MRDFHRNHMRDVETIERQEEEIKKLEKQNKEKLVELKYCIDRLENEGFGVYGLHEIIEKMEGEQKCLQDTELFATNVKEQEVLMKL